MAKPKLIVLLACIWGSLNVYAQESKNVTLVGQLSYGGNIFLADIWGYVAEDGTEYALVGTRHGVSIVSLADSTNPVQVQFVQGAESAWRDMKTFQHYAYVSNEGGGGLQIIDLSGLPNEVSFKDTIIAGVETIHNLWVDDAGVLYMVGLDKNVFNGGMVFCDLNQNPWIPQLVGIYDQRYVHDVYVRNNLAYAAEINARQLTIIDVSDKANPVELGRKTYLNAFTHNTWLNDAGDVCFTTDETANIYLRSWDVSTPSNIQALDSIRSSLSNGEAITHNVHVLNDFLITSYYADGLHITDAHRPDILVEVGYYDTSPIAGARVEGCWGAYPFLPSGLILVTDIEEGLFVFRPNFVRASYLEGNVRDAANGQLLEGATVTVLPEVEQVKSNLAGTYKLGLEEAGTYQIVVFKFGYLPDTLETHLISGQTTLLDVELTPAPSVNFEIKVVEQSSGSIIPDAKIQAIPLGTTESFSFRTNQNGIASIENITAGIYQLIVGKWGYVTKSLDIQLSAQEAITVTLREGYFDEFSLDFGWETEATATAGLWERGAPRLTTRFSIPINPGTDWEEDFGDKAYVTGSVGETYFDNDVDNGFTVLRSPIFDLSQYEDPVISYYWWLVNYQDGTQGLAGNGSLQVHISNSQQTELVTIYANSFNGDTWNLAEFRVRDFLEPDDQMRIEFTAADPEPGNLVEAGVDGFSIRDQAATDLTESSGGFDISLYPNPVSDQLFFRFDMGEPSALIVSVFDLRGSLIHQRAIWKSSGLEIISFPFPAGMYLVQVRQQNRLLLAKKLIKR